MAELEGAVAEGAAEVEALEGGLGGEGFLDLAVEGAGAVPGGVDGEDAGEEGASWSVGRGRPAEMTGAEVRWRLRTEATFWPASRIHWGLMNCLTSKTA